MKNYVNEKPARLSEYESLRFQKNSGIVDYFNDFFSFVVCTATSANMFVERHENNSVTVHIKKARIW